jgi:beta-1,2-xylosyltransferase
MINYGAGQTASPRIPYRAEATPPRAPSLRLHSPSPLRQTRPISDDDYPESPTRNIRRLASTSRSPDARIRPPQFTLAAKQPLKKRFKIPRTFRAVRKALTCIILVSILILLAQEGIQRATGLTAGLNVAQLSQLKARWMNEVIEEPEGQCRFVSTVEAYQRDLERLRRTHRHHPSHLDLSLHTKTPPRDSNTSTSHSHNNHIFSPTGHLLVSPSPSAAHPIPLLLTLGEKRWEELLVRQSRSLEEAVREYTRRYNRPPPKGFNIWWDFAMYNDLVLPDEYDRINLDLAPFFALPKGEMKRRMGMVEGMKETFTLVIENGRVEIQVSRYSSHHGRLPSRSSRI